MYELEINAVNTVCTGKLVQAPAARSQRSNQLPVEAIPPLEPQPGNAIKHGIIEHQIIMKFLARIAQPRRDLALLAAQNSGLRELAGAPDAHRGFVCVAL